MYTMASCLYHRLVAFMTLLQGRLALDVATGVPWDASSFKSHPVTFASKWKPEETPQARPTLT